jgi:glutathione-regulated potassium-efflux system ancillary protein KefF
VFDLLYAHPYPQRSRANLALLRAVKDLPGVEVRPLYDLYPDFAIDVEAEREALLRARVVIWQHPMYWYGVPPLLKLFFDKVLGAGWAYGTGGTALHGKSCLWVVTTGGDETAFRHEGMHGHPMAAFVPPVEQTARFCGMEFLPPLVLHGAHRIDDETLARQAASYRERLVVLARERGGG